MKSNEIPGLDSLYNDHFAALWRYAFRLCGNTDEADDLTMATLEKAAECREIWRREASLRTWLAHILKNRFLDTRRSAAARAVSLEALYENWEDYCLPLALRSENPAAMAEAKMEAGRILALSRYPDLLRDVALHGYSLPELAERDGVNLEMLTGRYQRDRKRLQKILFEP